MALPLSTTTLTVLRPPPADAYAEPYSGVRETDLITVTSGVPAVLYVSRNAGQETARGGEQTETDLRFASDVCDLINVDYVRDETTAVLYRVAWCFTFSDDHIEGGLKLVEGLV